MRCILKSNHLTKNPLILRDISLEIKQGEIFGIIGGSGAGKSSLMKCLSSLDSDFSGQVLFNNAEYPFHNKKQLKSIRKEIGMIFQHFYLCDSKTAAQNVALPLLFHGLDASKRVDALLDRVGLLHKKDAYPATLSGGEKQRVAIARALACNPSILFCDEATSALDPKKTKEILSLLKELNEDLELTIVLITHEMDVVKNICHTVSVMDQGRVIEAGSVLDVFSNPKEQITRDLIQNTTHEMDFSPLREEHTLFLRLQFTGESTKKPILSHLISSLGVEINILSGWIDTINNTPIGSLTITLKGREKEKALAFFHENHVAYEVLK